MPTPNKPPEKLPLDKVFAPGGWLAKHHPNYEFRPGQLEMAESVEFALESRQHLLLHRRVRLQQMDHHLDLDRPSILVKGSCAELVPSRLLLRIS